MRLEDLKRYGLSERLLDIWRKRQGERLLPIQERSVRTGLLQADQEKVGPNLVISGPTSSGKSFCAELAALKAISSQQRVIMVLPLRSLAEEKYRLYAESFASLGLKTLLVTGDHPENDRPFLSGDYHLALIINEKFDLLLTRRLDLLGNVGLIVLDEIQLLSESSRGAVLEKAVTKILGSPYAPRLIALTAMLAECSISHLCRWLEAKLVEERQRPVDLLLGVVADQSLRYRSYNGESVGEEEFPLRVGDSSVRTAWQLLAERIASDPGQTLLFVKSRSEAVQAAIYLAIHAGSEPATAALGLLAEEEPSALLTSLSQALTQGVAFYGSDLTAYQREVIQESYRAGEIRILCATSSLALGVNLPADTVYLDKLRYRSGLVEGRPEAVPISRAEYANMAGRAGRLGFESDQTGKAILLAESDFEAEVLWEAYIAPSEPPRLVSRWGSPAIEDWVLDMVVCGLATDCSDLHRLIDKTYWGQTKPEALDLEPRTQAALSYLESSGLVRETTSGCFEATSAGSATASSGLSQAEADYYLETLTERLPGSRFGWLAAAFSSPHWPLPVGLLNWYEQINNMPVRMLYQKFDGAVEEAACLLPSSEQREPLSYRKAVAIKAALLIEDWSRLVPVATLEERYGVHLGQIVTLGREAAHLLVALARLLTSIESSASVAETLSGEIFSVRCGLPPEMEELHQHLGQSLGRGDFVALSKVGINNPRELEEATLGSLERLIVPPAKKSIIIDLHHLLKEEVDMQPVTANSRDVRRVGHPGQDRVSRAAVLRSGLEPKSIEIDGSFQGDRFLVRIDGIPVHLTGKSFKYLAKLAWSRVRDNNGWIYKEDIEVGFNQARYLYRMKNEINQGFPSQWPVVENNRLGYYRLQIEPGRISLNLDILRDHPDYEVRSLFNAGEGSRGAVN